MTLVTDEHDYQISTPVHGMRCYTSLQGHRIIELDRWVDPTHTPEWEKEERKVYASERDWRREHGRDWSSPAGFPVFPGFSELGAQRFIHMATRLIKGPVFRGFDFGVRRPAMVCFQYDPTQDRVWYYREFMPHELQTHAFRDACRVLCNELPYGEAPEESRRWVDMYAARPSGAHCPPPWFPLGTRFVNIAGPEAFSRQANAIDKDEAVAADIFAHGGIELLLVSPKVLGRTRIVGRFVKLWPDGLPGMLLDPQMEEAIAGFTGEYSYPEPTAANPVPTEPRKDGHFENIMDALGYGTVGVVPEDAPKGKPEPKLVGYRGREPVYFDPALVSDEVGWNETRRR